MTQNK